MEYSNLISVNTKLSGYAISCARTADSSVYSVATRIKPAHYDFCFDWKDDSGTQNSPS